MLQDQMIKHSWLRKVSLFVLGCAISPFLLLTLFANPAYDDYCFAARTIKVGFLGSQKYLFETFNGRYFGNALLGLSPIVFGSFDGYKITALVIILLTFASIFWFVNALFDSSLTLMERTLAASLLTILFSNGMPDVTEAYYWMAGSISYQLPAGLTLCFFALAIKSTRSSGFMKSLILAVNCLLIVAIVGTSETAMIYLLFFIGCVTTKVFVLKSRNRWLWLGLLVLTICCAAIVISAPGNAVRAQSFPDKHRLFFSLGMSLAQEARFLAKWLISPPLILSTILFLPIARRLAEQENLFVNRLRLHPLTSLALLLFSVFLGFFPAYWATGMLGQYRSVNTAYFFFLLGWFPNLLIWVSYFKEKRWVKTFNLPSSVYLLGLPLLAISLLATNNTSAALADLLTNRAALYDQAVEERRSQFKQCAAEHIADCPVRKIAEVPETTANPYFEDNLKCEEWYWNLRTRSSAALP